MYACLYMYYEFLLQGPLSYQKSESSVSVQNYKAALKVHLHFIVGSLDFYNLYDCDDRLHMVHIVINKSMCTHFNQLFLSNLYISCNTYAYLLLCV